MRRHEVMEKMNDKCSECKGSGKDLDKECPDCGGTGKKNTIKENEKSFKKGEELRVSYKFLKDRGIPLEKGQVFSYRGYKVKLVESMGYKGALYQENDWWAKVVE